MSHFYESTLIDTVDGFQCKSYACEHPPGYIIVKPKYIPSNFIEGEGLRYRFLFEKCFVRFNLFAKKERVLEYVEQFKTKFPDYLYYSEIHQNWFFVVPRNKIKTIHDGRQGLKELMKVPKRDLDEYLKLTKELISFLIQSGVNENNLGITHSTLIGNYTLGKSDIDLIVYGKDNGWKILDYLKTAKHEKLKWKTKEEWTQYYQEHKTSESSHFTEKEYVQHMERKKYEGTFGGTVFTLFTSEEPEETWFKWGEATYTPLGLVTVKGKVTNHYNSHIRPGFYEISDGEIIESEISKNEILQNINLKRIVTYSIPFVQQAITGEEIIACGLLEKVTPKQGDVYYRVVVGYFDAYISDRREKEFIKRVIE